MNAIVAILSDTSLTPDSCTELLDPLMSDFSTCKEIFDEIKSGSRHFLPGSEGLGEDLGISTSLLLQVLSLQPTEPPARKIREYLVLPGFTENCWINPQGSALPPPSDKQGGRSRRRSRSGKSDRGSSFERSDSESVSPQCRNRKRHRAFPRSERFTGLASLEHFGKLAESRP